MATEHGRTSRLVGLARKHDTTLLQRAMNKHHKYLKYLVYPGLREQANYLLAELGDFAEDLVTGIVEEDQKIGELSTLVEQGSGRNKLICAVFNAMAKDVQNIVMDGREAQLRYLVDKYGLAKTREIVKKLTN